MGIIILSVEDDNAAYRLLQIALGELGLGSNLYRTRDGEEGLRFLRRQPPFQDSPSPDLVLLNLNMPKMSGMEVLAEIRSDPSLQHNAVVVFSSSDLDEDRARCLALGARQFITKPKDFTGLQEAVTEACRYCSASA